MGATAGAAVVGETTTASAARAARERVASLFTASLLVAGGTSGHTLLVRAELSIPRVRTREQPPGNCAYVSGAFREPEITHSAVRGTSARREQDVSAKDTTRGARSLFRTWRGD